MAIAVAVGDLVSVLLKEKDESIEAKGVVSFVGHTQFADGIWVGLQLNEEWAAFARNDGSVKGVRYFNTNGKLNGLFVKIVNVKVLNDSAKIKNEILLSKIEDLKAKLEVSEVEREILSDSNQIIQNKLKSLELELRGLKEIGEASDSFKSDPQLQDLLVAQNTFIEKEFELHEDIQNLEKQLEDKTHKLEMLTDEYNKLHSVYDDLKAQHNDLLEKFNFLEPHSTEQMIEKLTGENTELFIQNENLSLKNKELEDLQVVNIEMETEYQKSINELNTEISKLEIDLKKERIKHQELVNDLKGAENIIQELDSKLKKQKNNNSSIQMIEIINLVKDAHEEYGKLKLPNDIMRHLFLVKFLAKALAELLPQKYELFQLTKLRATILFELSQYKSVGHYNTDLHLECNKFVETLFKCINDGSLDLMLELPLLFESTSFDDIPFENALLHRETIIASSSINEEVLNWIQNLRSKNQGFEFFECEVIWRGGELKRDPREAQVIDIQSKSIWDNDKISLNSNEQEPALSLQSEELNDKISILQARLQSYHQEQKKSLAAKAQADLKLKYADQAQTNLTKLEKEHESLLCELEETKKVLDKLGFKRGQSSWEVLNWESTLEHAKLADYIKTLIATNKKESFEDLSWLEEWPQLQIPKQGGYNKTINQLFDLLSVEIKEENLLEYIINLDLSTI